MMSMGETMDTTADPGVTFEMPDDMPAAPPARAYENAANIVSQLTPDEQKALAKRVVETKVRDWDSSKKFRERRARQVELFAGIMPEKPQGHEKIAQIHLSIIAQSVLILHATIHGQLFPPTGYIYGARAVTPAAFERVRRVGLHMNWQVTTRIPEYLPANDSGMMQWLLYGTAFDCWYYDPIEKRPCYEFIHTDDIIIPYTCKSVRYDLSDVPHITKVVRKYQHEIEALVDVGFYDATNAAALFAEQDPKDLVPSEVQRDTNAAPMQRVEDRAQGQERQADDPTGPRVLLDHHCWYKLPGEKRQRPVIATVDEEKLTLLRLVIREREDPLDRARFNREQLANDAAHEAQMAQHQVDVADHAAVMEEMSTPKPVTDDLGMPVADPMTGAPAMLPPAPPEAFPPPPVEPLPPPPPAAVRMVTANWFTKYICIPNPEGIYGFGVGYLLEGDNIAADTLMSQYVSLLTMSLLPTFFYSKQAKLPRGDLQLILGGGQEVPLPPGMLKDAFFQFQFPQPGTSVPKLIQQREEAGRQLVGASSILTGDTGEANETATAAQLRNNAARMNLAEMGNRFNAARANSMRNLAALNATTMDPVEYFAVTLPGKGEMPPEEMEVARDDYLEDFQVTFTCDPRLASQPQRVQDAIALMGQLLSVPPGAIDPMVMSQLLKMAMVQYLRALDRDDMAAVAEQAQPPQMMPPGQPGQPGTQPGAANGNPGTKEGAADVGGPPVGPQEGVVQDGGNATLPPAS